VRHLPPSSDEWFRASDDLQGSDEYGNQDVSDIQWSVKFDESQFDEMMIMTGDGEVRNKLQNIHCNSHCNTHTATQDDDYSGDGEVSSTLQYTLQHKLRILQYTLQHKLQILQRTLQHALQYTRDDDHDWRQ